MLAAGQDTFFPFSFCLSSSAFPFCLLPSAFCHQRNTQESRMSPFPSIFVSHGAPDLLLTPSSSLDFLQQLGGQLGQPKAILVISAHWTTPVPTVSLATQPETIHDFWGFPAPLYELTYPAPGAPELADQVSKRLIEAGMGCELAADRGFDHGAWEPLLAMYPDAQIPVTQLSVQPHLGPAHHVQMGRALATLRQEGILVLASGAATHNFGVMPLMPNRQPG
jgi:4,5-DOPA dioxygenase extradiol